MGKHTLSVTPATNVSIYQWCPKRPFFTHLLWVQVLVGVKSSMFPVLRPGSVHSVALTEFRPTPAAPPFWEFVWKPGTNQAKILFKLTTRLNYVEKKSMLKNPAFILHPFMVVPALSDTQLYDQKEQLYSLSCRSSLFKLLHFFWSLLGVGFSCLATVF